MSAVLNDIGQLHFLRPLWLSGLLLLPAIAWWCRVDAQRSNPWRGNIDTHLLPYLLEGGAATQHRAWARWLGLLAASIAILAMAGPSWQKDEQPLWQSKAPLVVALDLSSSILARDLPPSRLLQARAKLATLLRERAGGQVALVAYANDAYTVAPLTEDAANVALFLGALSPDLMPEDGQRADRAIAWSRKLLQQTGFAQGEILLLTDHADAAAVSAAARAHAAGYRVSALGLGTEQGGVFETDAGSGQARLDAASLRRLSSSGGGAYQTLSIDAGDLHALGVLDPEIDGSAPARGEKTASWRDGGFWFLPLVMLLVLPLFRRGAGITAVFLLMIMLPLAPVPTWAQVKAEPVDAMPSKKTQDNSGLWKRRDQVDYLRLQEGINAYHKQDYPQAIESFSELHSADAQYNLGNALAQAGRLDDAIAAYDRALKLQPGMRDAIENRAAVEAARKRKPPPQDKPKQDQQKKQQQDKQQDSGKDQQQKSGQDQQHQQDKDGQDPQDKQDQAQSGKNEPQDKASKPDQSSSRQDASQPPDAKAQADADAAQRKRMKEALGKQAATDKPGEPVEKNPETPEQRERRLTNQAQLQRVPDDPGALLRARFRLEYERRRLGDRP